MVFIFREQIHVNQRDKSDHSKKTMVLAEVVNKVGAVTVPTFLGGSGVMEP